LNTISIPKNSLSKSTTVGQFTINIPGETQVISTLVGLVITGKLSVVSPVKTVDQSGMEINLLTEPSPCSSGLFNTLSVTTSVHTTLIIELLTTVRMFRLPLMSTNSDGTGSTSDTTPEDKRLMPSSWLDLHKECSN